MIQIETDDQFRVILPSLIPSTVSIQCPPILSVKKLTNQGFPNTETKSDVYHFG